MFDRRNFPSLKDVKKNLTFCIIRNNYWKIPLQNILYPFSFYKRNAVFYRYMQYVRNGRPFICYNNKSPVIIILAKVSSYFENGWINSKYICIKIKFNIYRICLDLQYMFVLFWTFWFFYFRFIQAKYKY